MAELHAKAVEGDLSSVPQVSLGAASLLLMLLLFHDENDVWSCRCQQAFAAAIAAAAAAAVLLPVSVPYSCWWLLLVEGRGWRSYRLIKCSGVLSLFNAQNSQVSLNEWSFGRASALDMPVISLSSSASSEHRAAEPVELPRLSNSDQKMESYILMMAMRQQASDSQAAPCHLHI